jgi:basic membrane lipoprotein Med (substrate-binding protein (PBP1-ABC) superfamily)
MRSAGEGLANSRHAKGETLKRVLVGGCTLLLAVAFAACGSSASNSGGDGSGLKVTWLYTGPAEDGGFNTANIVAMEAMDKVPGVEIDPIYNMPYSQESTQIVKQAIASGSNVIVDTLGLANLLTDACEQAPQVKCYGSADASEVPENSVAYWTEDWHSGYAAGVAAGLMTESNTVGFIGPTQIPISISAANTFALGCQSVNPECKVRAIYINSYFDPAKAAQAANSLVDAGADVLRNYVDDPSFCQVAEKRGVLAVGQYNDFHETCPNSIITSTFWGLSDYFTEQVKVLQDGKFKGSGDQPVYMPATNSKGGVHLGEWGDFVPQDVRDRVQTVWDEMIDGKRFIVGPIYDQNGVLKVKKGEAPSDNFLFYGWDWFVDGVISSQ